MTALAGIRPAPYALRTFAAFRVSTGWITKPGGCDTSPIAEVEADSIDDALNLVLGKHCLSHKDRLVIREDSEETGAALLHVFAIRQKAPRWVHPRGELQPRRVVDLYADPVCVIDAAVLGEGR